MAGHFRFGKVEWRRQFGEERVAGIGDNGGSGQAVVRSHEVEKGKSEQDLLVIEHPVIDVSLITETPTVRSDMEGKSVQPDRSRVRLLLSRTGVDGESPIELVGSGNARTEQHSTRSASRRYYSRRWLRVTSLSQEKTTTPSLKTARATRTETGYRTRSHLRSANCLRALSTSRCGVEPSRCYSRAF